MVPEKVNQLFPFEPGDKLTYISDSNDTLVFVCSKRELLYSKGSQDSDVQSECCGPYSVEDLHVYLESPDGTTIEIITQNISRNTLIVYVTIENIKLHGSWPGQFDPIPTLEPLDSIQLVGEVYYNIYKSDNDEEIYLDPDSLGIVGFIIGGKEWRLL